MSEKKLRLARAREEYARCKMELAAAQIDVIEAEEPETVDKCVPTNVLLCQQNYSQTEDHTNKEQITKELVYEVSQTQEVQISASSIIEKSITNRILLASATLEERRNYISECIDNIRKQKLIAKKMVFQGADDSNSNLVKRLQNWPQRNSSVEDLYTFAAEVAKLQVLQIDEIEGTILFNNLLQRLPETVQYQYFEFVRMRLNEKELTLFVEFCNDLAEMCLPYIPTEEERRYLLPDPTGCYIYHSGDTWDGVGWISGICELLFLEQLIKSHESVKYTPAEVEKKNREADEFILNNQMLLKVLKWVDYCTEKEFYNYIDHVVELKEDWISPFQGRIMVLLYLDRSPWKLRYNYLRRRIHGGYESKSESESFIKHSRCLKHAEASRKRWNVLQFNPFFDSKERELNCSKEMRDSSENKNKPTKTEQMPSQSKHGSASKDNKVHNPNSWRYQTTLDEEIIPSNNRQQEHQQHYRRRRQQRKNRYYVIYN